MVIVADWAEVDTQHTILEPSEEEIAEWKWLKTAKTTLVPSEEEVAEWKLLKTVKATLTPSTEEVGGWKVLKTVDVTLTPKGVAVCTPGKTKCVGKDFYTCGDDKQWHLTEANSAKCVAKPFNWLWVVAGGAGIAAVLLLAPKKKEVK